MLQEVELGKEAVEYIRLCLSEGKTFASYLSELPIEEGTVAAYLPITVRAETLTQFNVGGVVPAEESDEKIVDFIAKHFVKHPEGCLMLENAVAQPSYSYVNAFKSTIRVYNMEVYHYLSARDSSGDAIKETIREASSYLFIGALTSIDTDFLEDHELSQESLKTLAAHATVIIVGAYDNEAYVVWKNKNSL